MHLERNDSYPFAALVAALLEKNSAYLKSVWSPGAGWLTAAAALHKVLTAHYHSAE